MKYGDLSICVMYVNNTHMIDQFWIHRFYDRLDLSQNVDTFKFKAILSRNGFTEHAKKEAKRLNMFYMNVDHVAIDIIDDRSAPIINLIQNSVMRVKREAGEKLKIYYLPDLNFIQKKPEIDAEA